jgi:exopolysaccharide biosynthesis polyprenyl glycosylphosphotransferase
MSNRAKTILLLLLDTLILVLSLTIVVTIRRSDIPPSEYLMMHYHLFSFIFPLWLLMYFIEGLYTLKTYNPANLPVSLIRGTIFSVIISILGIYMLPHHLEKITPKTNLILIALLATPMLYFWRRWFFNYFAHQRRLRGTILIGSDETLKLVEEEINRKPYLGYRIVGAHPTDLQSVPVTPDVQLIAVERNVTKDQKIYSEIFNYLGTGIEIIDLAKFAEHISGKIPIRAIDESWFIEYCGHQESRSFDVVKNLIDRSVALILMILLAPLALILLPILLIVDGRPIFFKQVRTGLNNKPFTLFKLRTMVIDAEKAGAQWARPGDARITPLGKILRKTRLDELPQLINILKGEMSLVGPRPERPEIIANKLAPNIPFYHLRHLVKPGVTGWAQVTFRYGFSTEDSLEKLQYDLFYVKNRNGWLDLIVILKTIKTVLTGAGQ